MYPGYTGSYPKIQLYLGSEDTIIGSAAFNMTLAAWATVLGYDSSPDQVQSDTPVDGWTTYVLGSKLEGIWAEGVGHPVSVQGEEDMKWWGFAR
jgi:acetylxylan esterase